MLGDFFGVSFLFFGGGEWAEIECVRFDFM